MIMNILFLCAGFCAQNPASKSLPDQIKEHKKAIKQAKSDYQSLVRGTPEKQFFTPRFHQTFDANTQNFLIKTIEDRLYGPKITGARLLYRFPDTEKKNSNNTKAQHFDQTNFHQYIDHQENLLVVITLANGYKVGGWIKNYIGPQSNMGDGLLFELRNPTAYTLKIPDSRLVTYDNFYLIMGNSELRIRTSESGFFSNFGIANAYFDNNITSGAKTCTDFCGQPETQIEFYEIYQLQLDGKWPFISHANWVQNLLEWHDREDVETRQEWMKRREAYNQKHAQNICDAKQKKLNENIDNFIINLLKIKDKTLESQDAKKQFESFGFDEKTLRKFYFLEDRLKDQNGNAKNKAITDKTLDIEASMEQEIEKERNQKKQEIEQLETELQSNDTPNTRNTLNALHNKLKNTIETIQKQWETKLNKEITLIEEHHKTISDDITKRIKDYKENIKNKNTQLKDITLPERRSHIIAFFKALCQTKESSEFWMIDNFLQNKARTNDLKSEWKKFTKTKVFTYKKSYLEKYNHTYPNTTQQIAQLKNDDELIKLSFEDVKNWGLIGQLHQNNELEIIFEWINTYCTEKMDQMAKQNKTGSPDKQNFQAIFSIKNDNAYNAYENVVKILEKRNETQNKYDTKKKEITEIVAAIKKEIDQVEKETGAIITEHTQESLVKETDQPNVFYFETKKDTSYSYDGLYHLKDNLKTTFEKYWDIREQIDPEIALRAEKTE